MSPELGFSFNIGLQAQFRFYEASFGEWLDGGLYGWGGVAYGNRPYVLVGGIPQGGLSAGAGIGIEPVFFKHFSTPIEFGYSASWDLSSITPQSAGVVIQGGLRYRF